VPQQQATDLCSVIARMQQAVTDAAENSQLGLCLEMLASFSQKEIADALAKLGREGLNRYEHLFSLALQHAEEKVVLGAVEALGALRCQEAGKMLARINFGRYPSHFAKKVKKAVSRSLHRLKSTGIELPSEIFSAPPEGEQPAIMTSRRFYKAFVTSNDYSGNIHGILIMRTSGGKYETASIIFNDSRGITHTRLFSFNQRELDSYLANCNMEKDGIRLVETTGEYLNFLAGRYLPLNQTEKQPVPPEFNHYCRRYLEPASECEQHPVYKELSLESIEEAMPFLLSRSEELMSAPEMMHWVLDREAIADYAQQMVARRRSKIMVTGAFLAEYKLKLAQEAAEKIFTPEFTSRFISRLEHLAWVYLGAGQRENARLALAVAVDLKKGKEPFRNPFVQALAVSSLEAMADYLEHPEEEAGEGEECENINRAPSGLLLLPGSTGRY